MPSQFGHAAELSPSHGNHRSRAKTEITCNEFTKRSTSRRAFIGLHSTLCSFDGDPRSFVLFDVAYVVAHHHCSGVYTRMASLLFGISKPLIPLSGLALIVSGMILTYIYIGT